MWSALADVSRQLAKLAETPWAAVQPRKVRQALEKLLEDLRRLPARVRAYEGHTDLLHCLALCPQRRQLFSGSEDGSLRLWDVRAHKCAQVLRPHAPPLSDRCSMLSQSGRGPFPGIRTHGRYSPWPSPATGRMDFSSFMIDR